jgi:protein-disulfide isomerase
MKVLPMSTRLALAVVVVAVIAGVALLTLGSGGAPTSARVASGLAAAEHRIKVLLAGVPEHEDVLGDPAAPVTLQVFGDLQCPTTRQFVVGAFPFLVREWVRAGVLRIVYRSLRTTTSEIGLFKTQQIAALAAGMQDRLWYYVDLFYHEQAREHSGYVTEGFLQRIARQTPGLKRGLWGEYRFDPLLSAQVAEDGRTARREGFDSTPSFLVGFTAGGNVTRLLPVSQLEPQPFNVAIERLLATTGMSRSARAAVDRAASAPEAQG